MMRGMSGVARAGPFFGGLPGVWVERSRAEGRVSANRLLQSEWNIDVSGCQGGRNLAANRTRATVLGHRLVDFIGLNNTCFCSRVFSVLAAAISLEQFATEPMHVRTIGKLHDVLPSLRTDKSASDEAFSNVGIPCHSGISRSGDAAMPKPGACSAGFDYCYPPLFLGSEENNTPPGGICMSGI
jgi:hypothetical protein